MRMVITEDSTVTLYFSLSLESGEVVDSNFEKEPAILVMGDGSMLPGFEKHLIGLYPGDKKTVEISQEYGFGAHNPQNVQQFKRTDFASDMELSEGLIVSFADASGSELPGMIKSYDQDKVVIDFNHPLAGRAITFSVEIVDVQ